WAWTIPRTFAGGNKMTSASHATRTNATGTTRIQIQPGMPRRGADEEGGFMGRDHGAGVDGVQLRRPDDCMRMFWSRRSAGHTLFFVIAGPLGPPDRVRREHCDRTF